MLHNSVYSRLHTTARRISDGDMASSLKTCRIKITVHLRNPYEIRDTICGRNQEILILHQVVQMLTTLFEKVKNKASRCTGLAS